METILHLSDDFLKGLVEVCEKVLIVVCLSAINSTEFCLLEENERRQEPLERSA
jgi:hypothetical protein